MKRLLFAFALLIEVGIMSSCEKNNDYLLVNTVWTDVKSTTPNKLSFYENGKVVCEISVDLGLKTFRSEGVYTVKNDKIYFDLVGNYLLAYWPTEGSVILRGALCSREFLSGTIKYAKIGNQTTNNMSLSIETRLIDIPWDDIPTTVVFPEETKRMLNETYTIEYEQVISDYERYANP